MPENNPSSLLGMDRAQLTALVGEAGEPAYRVKQIVDAVYRGLVGARILRAGLPSL